MSGWDWGRFGLTDPNLLFCAVFCILSTYQGIIIVSQGLGNTCDLIVNKSEYTLNNDPFQVLFPLIHKISINTVCLSVPQGRNTLVSFFQFYILDNISVPIYIIILPYYFRLIMLCLDIYLIVSLFKGIHMITSLFSQNIWSGYLY